MWSASLAWKIEFDRAALKDLSGLDKPVARRITRFLRERVAALDDPRRVGQALTDPTLGEFWKYRVGDYRIICTIQDSILTILVVRVGNRREVYRK